MAPENTMPAFQLAYELKVDSIETDVQLTKDNIPVLIHDETVDRTTDGTGFIKDLTYEQLLHLDAGSWFNQKYAKTPIISLQQFLQWVKQKPLHLNIELKNNKIDYKHLESIVYEMLKDFKVIDRTTLSTFNPKSVKRLNAECKGVEIAFLRSKRKGNLVQAANDLGANAIHVNYKLLNKKLMIQSNQYNMPVRIYTVNKVRHMLRCYHLKCHGIFTDIPDRAIKTRKLFIEKNK